MGLALQLLTTSGITHFSHRSPEQLSARWLWPTPGRSCAVKKLLWCMLVGAAMTLHFNTGIWSQDAKDAKTVVPPKILPPTLEVKQDAVKKEDPKKDELQKEKEEAKKDDVKKDDAKKEEHKKDEVKKDDGKKEEAKKDDAKKDDGKKEEPKKEEPKAEAKGDPTGGGNKDLGWLDDDIKKGIGQFKD